MNRKLARLPALVIPSASSRSTSVRVEREQSAQRQSIGELDPEVVGGQRERAATGHGADADIDRSLGLERAAAAQPGDTGGRGNRAVVDQVGEREHVLGRHVERVLLSGSRARKPVLRLPRNATRPESGTRPESLPFRVLPKSAKCSKRTAVPTAQSRVAPRSSTSPYTAALARFQRPAAIGLKPGVPLEPTLKPWAAYGPWRHDSGWPRPIRNCSLRHSTPPATCTGSPKARLRSRLTPISRCPYSPTSNAVGVAGPSDALTVLRMEKSAVFAPAVTLASQRTLPASCPRRPPTAETSRSTPPKARREPAREALLEREAVRVVEDLSEHGRIGHVVRNRHRGAVRRANAARRQHVADEQGPAAVVAEHAAAGVRIPVVVEREHVPARIVRVAVRLHAVGEQVAEVGEELEVVLDIRRSPPLGRIADVAIPGGDEGRRVGPLHAAVGGRAGAVFQAEVGEAVPAERQADVGGDAVLPAVAGAMQPAVQLDDAAGAVVPEQQVQYAGDGIRAVLRGCARRAAPRFPAARWREWSRCQGPAPRRPRRCLAELMTAPR